MRLGVAIATAAAVILLTACGGGDGNADQLSAEEFRQQADAVCTEFEGRLEELGTPDSLNDLDEYVADAIPILEEGTARLEELEPPDELAEDWDRTLELNREQLDAVRELQEAAAEGDEARVGELLQQAQDAQAESRQLAAELGLEQCGGS